MKPIEIIKQADGTNFEGEDGDIEEFKLLPGLSESEILELESRVPCYLPDDIRELLQFSRGFDGVLDSVDFSGLYSGFDFENIFICPIPIAHDGFGNYWIVDLTSKSVSWGPIFFVCHDAPVIVYQTDSLGHFISEVLKFGNPPWKSEIDDVHEEYHLRIWNDNPGLLSYKECINSGDIALKDFAESLDNSFHFIDLRSAKTGSGWSWGRYGPKTVNCRYKEELIFAYQKKTFLQRLLGK